MKPGLRLAKSAVVKLNKYVKIVFSPRYLVFTNITISGTLSGVGDALEQNYELIMKDLERYSFLRTARMSASGVTVGLVCHYWYKALDDKLPGRTLKIVAKKILVDQFIGSPICIATFFCTLGIIEGSGFEEFKAEVKKKFIRLYVAEWVVWPTAQFINFYFLPNKYRVLYDNMVSLIYDTYTSHVKYGDTKDINHDR